MLNLVVELGIVLVTALIAFGVMNYTARTPQGLGIVLLYFSLTLFVSATLLLGVQPMIGKLVLPQLGGTPAVWNTCMVFFQGTLLVGYGYSHVLATTQPPRRQVMIQCIMILFPLLVLPFTLGAPPEDSESNPIFWLMGKLVILAGLPYFAVSATAPLLQKWFAHTGHPAAKDPYFLYGASNLGSMLGLGLYPTVLEPWLQVAPGENENTIHTQVHLWEAGFAVFVGLMMGCAFYVWRGLNTKTELPAPARQEPAADAARLADVTPVQTATAITGAPRRRGARLESGGHAKHAATPMPEVEIEPVPDDNITLWRRLRWIGLAAVPSSLMLGVTTYMTTDIAAVAFFWIIPLMLYLLTFILVFARWPVIWTGAGASKSLSPHIVVLFLQPMLLLFLVLKMTANLSPPTWLEFTLHVGSFFGIALMCHGELARDRPSPKHLTEFFFLMSLGGVLGGLFNAFFAPIYFQHGIWEYPIAMAVACLLRPNLVDDVKALIPWDSTAECSTPVGYILDFIVPILIGLWAAGALYLVDQEAANPIAQRYASVAMLTGIAVIAIVVCFYQWAGEPQSWNVRQILEAALGYDSTMPLADNIQSGHFLARVAIIILDIIGTLFLLLKKDPLIEPLKRSYLLAILVVLTLALSLRPLRFGLAVAALFLGVGIYDRYHDSLLYEGRGFFGLLRVRESVGTWYSMPGKNHGEHGSKEWKVYRTLIHGGINHGRQITGYKEFDGTDEGFQSPELTLQKRREPITYFHERNGVAEVYSKASWPDARLPASMVGFGASGMPMFELLTNTQSEPPYAVLGLGTGILGCYAKPYQTCHFYEIDPLVRNLSFPPDGKDPVFWFLKDAKDRGADISVIMGDGRLRLKDFKDFEFKDRNGKHYNPEKYYHIISLDAFSSDAIPVHLLTAEAIELYMSKLADGGVLVFNTTNRYVRIEGVLSAIAKKKGYDCLHCPDYTYDTDHPDRYSADWVVMQRRIDKTYKNGGPPIHDRLEKTRKRTNWFGRPVLNKNDEEIIDDRWQEVRPLEGPIWTDAYSNLLKIMRWR